MEACSLFGHHNVPDDIKNKLNNLLVDLIENQKVSLFYVGNHGQFDSIVRGCLRELKKKYPQISYYVVLAYLPQNPKPYEDYSDTIFPEGLETVFPRFAIIYRNQWMIRHADIVAAYMWYEFGNTAKFVRYAKQQGKEIILL